MSPCNRSRTMAHRWLGHTLLALTPLACAVSVDALAQDFQWGEISGRANGSLSVGSIWSAENPASPSVYQGNATSIGYGSPGQYNPKGGATAMTAV